MPTKKTEKRIEGLTGIVKTVAEKNPVAHAVLTAKDLSDNTYKIRYGRDPKRFGFANQRRFARPVSQAERIERLLRKRQRIVLEEDPLKRALRNTKDPELKRVLRDLMR